MISLHFTVSMQKIRGDLSKQTNFERITAHKWEFYLLRHHICGPLFFRNSVFDKSLCKMEYKPEDVLFILLYSFFYISFSTILI